MLKIFSRSREEVHPYWGVKPRFWDMDTLSLVTLAQCSKVSLDRCRFFRKEAAGKRAAIGVKLSAEKVEPDNEKTPVR
jgi:hypothetical protein